MLICVAWDTDATQSRKENEQHSPQKIDLFKSNILFLRHANYALS